MDTSQFVPHPSCYVPINPALRCGEVCTAATGDTDDDEDMHYPVTFHITLPSKTVRLNFYCRDRSSGVLLPTESALSTKDEGDNMNDPFFFEKGFYLEAKTGFQPWPGSRLMIEAFTCMKNERMTYWQKRLTSSDLDILELGAGIGLVGTCLAAAGANVLLTDLPVLVEHGIIGNLKRNKTHFDVGSAKAQVLDWLKPISEQLSNDTSFDVIVACDCLFLRKLIDPLLNVISDLFHQSSKNSPKLLFTYERRNMMGVFIGLEELLERIKYKGWSVECLAWRTIPVEGDGEHKLYLFEVTPCKIPTVQDDEEEKKEMSPSD